MIELIARAKVNLYLHVTGKRADGYHTIDSLIAFADVGDGLRVEAVDTLSLEVGGPFAGALSGGASDNLVMRAARALQTEGGHAKGARMALTKQLPVASGIGGGSADAAAALLALNELWSMGLAKDALKRIARTLGSDVPVCVEGKSVRAQGVGDVLTPVVIPALHAVLVNPLAPVPTPEVYARVRPPYTERSIRCDAEMLGDCRNDLEAAAIEIAPVIGEILTTLKALPKVNLARMSGSGATCFALFGTAADAAQAAETLKTWWPGYWITPAILGKDT